MVPSQPIRRHSDALASDIAQVSETRVRYELSTAIFR